MTARAAPLVVVVSAMGDATERLIVLAREMSSRPDEREIDMLLATGEQISASLLAMALHELDCPALSLAGWQAKIETDSRFSFARIRDVNVERIEHELSRGKVVIVTGFQGIGSDTGWEEITTLGRGGSDATAVALAARLAADSCEIFTDVEGIYTADPRVVPAARKLKSISYEEMLELAQHGARVMMPRAVELAQISHVPLEVRSSFSFAAGTRIGGDVEQTNRVVGVVHEPHIAKVTFVELADRPGIAHAVFSALADRNVQADLIVQNVGHHGRTDLSFTVSESDLPIAMDVSERVLGAVDAREIISKGSMAKVSIVGSGIGSNLEYASTMFGALSAHGINIDIISTSGIRITCVVDGERGPEALQALHTAFDLERELDRVAE